MDSAVMSYTHCSRSGVEPPTLSVGVWFWRLRPPHQQGIPKAKLEDNSKGASLLSNYS